MVWFFCIALPLGYLIAVAYAVGIHPHMWRLGKPGQDAQAVIHLLALEPEGWRFDPYIMHHAESRIGIWIANEAYGLGWWVGDRDDHRNNVKPSKGDQERVWRAVGEWKRSPDGNGVGYAAKAALVRLSRERALAAPTRTPPERP